MSRIPPKRCPFCGGRAEVDCSGWLWMHCQWVSCTKCGASGPAVDADDYTIIKTEAQLAAIAVRKWNRRVPNP